MSRAFLDTVGLLAVWDDADQWHATASQAYAVLMSRRVRLFATTYVLSECGNHAARKPFRLDVDDLRTKLDTKGQLIRPTDADWDAAWQSYRRGGPSSPGIVDELSFCVMRRLGITDVFGNDKHFRAAGFTTLF